MKLTRVFKYFATTTSQFCLNNTKFLPTIFLFYIAALLIHQLIVSDINRVSTLKQNNYTFYSTKNAHILEENKRLTEELHYLQENTEMIESLARSQLGYIKEGEQFYTYGVQTPQTQTFNVSPPTPLR